MLPSSLALFFFFFLGIDLRHCGCIITRSGATAHETHLLNVTYERDFDLVIRFYNLCCPLRNYIFTKKQRKANIPFKLAQAFSLVSIKRSHLCISTANCSHHVRVCPVTDRQNNIYVFRCDDTRIIKDWRHWFPASLTLLDVFTFTFQTVHKCNDCAKVGDKTNTFIPLVEPGLILCRGSVQRNGTDIFFQDSRSVSFFRGGQRPFY